MVRRRKADPKLEAARDILLRPFLECVGPIENPYSNQDKLHLAFGEGHREIHKRKVLGSVKVTGLWWKELERKLGSYTLKKGWNCYVREDFRESTVDIEAQVNVWVGGKKSPVKNVWMTATLTQEQYAEIDIFLGPREELCSTKLHKEGK